MHLRLHTFLSRFGYELAADLEARGLGTVAVHTGPTAAFELRHKPAVSGGEVAKLLEALKPLQPASVLPDPDLDGADVVLNLGDEHALNAWEVRIDCDSPELAGRVRDAADDLGFRDLGTNLGVQDADTLLYAAASAFSRQVLRWQLKKMGVKVREQRQTSWADDDDDIWLSLRDPAAAGKPIVERFAVRVQTDDPAQGEKLIDWLKQAGFRCLPVESLPESQALEKPFSLAPGPFGGDRAPTELARLTVTVQDLISDARIDTGKFPLRVLGTADGATADVVLPFAGCKSGKKPPYSGPYPERFKIRIHTDDVAKADDLRCRLRDAGFPGVEVVPADGDDLARGFAVNWGAAGKEPAIGSVIRQAVEAAMLDAGAGPPFELSVADQFSADDSDVWVYFPLKGVTDGSLLERLSDPGRFTLKLHCPDPAGWEDVLEQWRRWGFQGCTAETSEVRRPMIDFGGAPAVLLERVKKSIAEAGGVTVTTSKRWEDGDRDVWVYLPERPETSRKPAGGWETDAFDVRSWFRHDLEALADQYPTFLEATADRVRIGPVWLPRRKSQNEVFVPDPATFAHFCLDGRTAETLHHVALSVALREPCLLEGETSTSKTSSILYLASLLGQPVVRINLNGQTDTGELVGRYVPKADHHGPHAAADHGSGPIGLTAATAQWRWQDGPVVTALKKGWWVLLDEVNLAEPQILERLNSVLEREPTFVLTEHDHSAFGTGGSAIHPDFRIFATMNPAEYAGRSVLSPAYRDRWRGHRFIPRPGEVEYLAMLLFLVHGQQPEVTLLGRRYPGGDLPAPLAVLAESDEIDDLLPALASFHAALEHAAGQGDGDPARIGGRRKERYVFTRRGLLSVMEYLASPFGGGAGQRPLREALLRYYLGRVSTPQDQRLIVQLLDAAGLAPGK
ncbi:MAG: AAA family ATPase [Gemmataceae bacterium]